MYGKHQAITSVFRGVPLFLAALILILSAAACDQSAPTSAIDAIAPNAAGKSEVPIRASGSGVLVQQQFAPGFNPPVLTTSTFDGRCSEPSHYLVEFALEGETSHLGEFTAGVSHCGMIDIATGASTDEDGILVMTASNGDELHAEYRCDPIPGPTFECSAVFGGGTGRFADAAGEATFGGVTHRPTGTIPGFWLEGWIFYDASEVSS